MLGTVGLSQQFWEPLEEKSETVRNIGLVAGGLIAVVLGAWRSAIAHKQADAAESDSLDRRFQTASEMLGHKEVPVKIAGVVALSNLARSRPERYVYPVSEILDNHARQRSRVESTTPRDGAAP